VGEAAFAARAAVAAVRQVRLDYLEKIAAVVAKSEARLAAKESVEAVARDAVRARNLLKLEERANGPWFAARWADLRNLVRYGDRAGPTAEQLFKQFGSWEKVLDKVRETSPAYDHLAR
jgi:hypothetical protein